MNIVILLVGLLLPILIGYLAVAGWERLLGRCFRPYWDAEEEHLHLPAAPVRSAKNR